MAIFGDLLKLCREKVACILRFGLLPISIPDKRIVPGSDSLTRVNGRKDFHDVRSNGPVGDRHYFV